MSGYGGSVGFVIDGREVVLVVVFNYLFIFKIWNKHTALCGDSAEMKHVMYIAYASTLTLLLRFDHILTYSFMFT